MFREEGSLVFRQFFSKAPELKSEITAALTRQTFSLIVCPVKVADYVGSF